MWRFPRFARLATRRCWTEIAPEPYIAPGLYLLDFIHTFFLGDVCGSLCDLRVSQRAAAG